GAHGGGPERQPRGGPGEGGEARAGRGARRREPANPPARRRARRGGRGPPRPGRARRHRAGPGGRADHAGVRGGARAPPRRDGERGGQGDLGDDRALSLDRPAAVACIRNALTGTPRFGQSPALMRRSRPVIAALALASMSAFTGTALATDVLVQGTTDVRDAGLLDDVIIPGFQAAYPQYTLKYVAVAPAQALTTARAGQADAVLPHAPTQESDFVNAGYSFEPFGRAIFYSDYVILGPANDPAGVL